MNPKKLRIAIDGPASAGKSTVAKIVAKDLGYVYCDTGAMYRALTYYALQNGVTPEDEAGLVELLKKMKLRFDPSTAIQKVFINNEEVTEAIRQPDVTNNVSAVSAHGEVRKQLVKYQQLIAADGGIVMDGRDIGTAVLPDAEVKIFMVASVSERAERRFKENTEKGIMTPLETIEKEIAERDYKDSTRAVSPLIQAEDAFLVDTTSLSIDGVVAKIKEIIAKQQ
ncbi:(d)CMP kinase [Carnobacterium divergens]|uniref:Cytidylate kinase n=2 Tax=Carnobacterium divergens TaxID=2748 RepID=A0A0R2HXP6_CARDV|nr:(d)CMP kinase [Carnobacterium divergens]KRN54381.1 cytidylate kinase [Carnobacterium divergens DSM 20623]MDO0873868.1 (d)CMP kinase [Carnobacterium divergens]MDT1957366.1 (d)CMP kinase [Carnobacterium divergens]MDT1973569.1 (d)CMP kinase [Carnobacterium divergens]MDT2010905.1 (d)CMP kinase [Carnobacterium divergens]